MNAMVSFSRVFGLGVIMLMGSAVISAATTEAGPSDNESIAEQSEFWPPYLALKEAVHDDGRVYKSGLKGVLIRVENDSKALIDFGRKGLLAVEIERTDFRERAEEIRSGEMDKEYPNWTMMVGRGFFEVRNGTLQPVPLSALVDFESFLFVYLAGQEEMEGFATYARQLDSRVEALEEAKCFPVVLHTQPKDGNDGIRKLLEEVGLELPFMRAHLTRAYAMSMQHAPEFFPHGVLTDAEGKTLVTQAAEESGADFLDRVFQELSPTGTE